METDDLKSQKEHYVENTGGINLMFLETFASDEFQNVSLNQWLQRLPGEILKAYLNINKEQAMKIPADKLTNQRYFRLLFEIDGLAIHENNLVPLHYRIAGAFRSDISSSTAKLLPTGHFALETHLEQVVEEMRDFLPVNGI